MSIAKGRYGWYAIKEILHFGSFIKIKRRFLVQVKSKSLLQKKTGKLKNLPAFVGYSSLNLIRYFFSTEPFLPHILHLKSFTTAVSQAATLH